MHGFRGAAGSAALEAYARRYGMSRRGEPVPGSLRRGREKAALPEAVACVLAVSGPGATVPRSASAS